MDDESNLHPLCCQDIAEVLNKTRGQCITEHRLFDLICLNRDLLNFARPQIQFHDGAYMQEANGDENR